MTPLRFRAWDKGNLNYGTMYDEVGIDPDGIPFIRGDYREDDWTMDDAIVMQSTGLHDKNGKEIFEGDVVHIEGWGVGVIEFIDGRFLAKNKIGEMLYWPSFCRTDHSPYEPEVIGNIYENPELLESACA